jgi:lipopolysaccharide/colanic/teichoic acid biosynthesis glycosyltransferase
MKIRINDKKINEIKVINILYVVLSVVRKIIVIAMAITQLILSFPFFIVINLLFGLNKANKYMDNIALNWMELFSNYR